MPTASARLGGMKNTAIAKTTNPKKIPAVTAVLLNLSIKNSLAEIVAHLF
jgi:hypothetical protein